MNPAFLHRLVLGLALASLPLSGFCALQNEEPSKTEKTDKTEIKTSDKAPEKSPEKSGGPGVEKKVPSPASDAQPGAPSSSDGLRLDVGGSGLLLGAPESPKSQGGVSGGTSLGPLPDFKKITPGQVAEPEPEEPVFPDVEMRRRARPELLPDGPNATEEAAVALRDRIRFRSLKTQALRDPAVRGALEASVKARSDREMREGLQRHYTLLYARMRALDGSLNELISQRETEALEKLREKLPR
jgi:hypothetical protein